MNADDLRSFSFRVSDMQRLIFKANTAAVAAVCCFGGTYKGLPATKEQARYYSAKAKSALAALAELLKEP